MENYLSYTNLKPTEKQVLQRILITPEISFLKESTATAEYDGTDPSIDKPQARTFTGTIFRHLWPDIQRSNPGPTTLVVDALPLSYGDGLSGKQ